MGSVFGKLLRSRKGATAVEYGLICALIVIAAMGAVVNFGDSVGEKWNNVADDVVNH